MEIGWAWLYLAGGGVSSGEAVVLITVRSTYFHLKGQSIVFNGHIYFHLYIFVHKVSTLISIYLIERVDETEVQLRKDNTVTDYSDKKLLS